MIESNREPSVVIVGAGMSGIVMGIELAKAGFDDFVILEKGSRAGGVWHWNHYPGLACDVPSHLYQYGFYLRPGWKHFFATGAEIRDYHEEVVDHFNLRPKIQFDTEVTGAKFVDGRWEVRTAAGETRSADFVVMATGVLHHPNQPDIPGIESFEGEVLHSAQWNDAVDWKGERVAVIGTGSTGVQLVSAFQPKAARVTQFARQPQWVIWAPTTLRQPAVLGKLLKRFPAVNRALFKFLMLCSWVFTDVTTRPSWRRRLVQNGARLHLKTVRDKQLRAKLTPDYEPLCKRQVVSGTYYRAVQKSNVELVTEAIERVEPKGIVDAEGTLHEQDLIVYATGFKAHNYMRPMAIVGRDGITIDEAWNHGPRAYLMTAIPGFPNLFTLLGPNSPVGSIQLQHAAQRSALFVAGWIKRYACGEFESVEVTDEATSAFNDKVREALGPTVWNTGCNSWYLKDDGAVDLWPFTRAQLDAWLAEPIDSDFILR